MVQTQQFAVKHEAEISEFYIIIANIPIQKTTTLVHSLLRQALPTIALLYCECYNLCKIVDCKFSTLVRDNWPPVAALLCLVA